METWKPIHPELYPSGGFKQTYSISDYGNVRNDKTGRILKRRPDNKGYERVNLAGKDIKVHRLVALHFIDNPEQHPEVNHEDGIKAHNHVSNLSWCSSQANAKHAHQTGLNSNKGEMNSQLKLSDQEVLKIWASNMTTKEIEVKYDLTKVYASRIRNKRVRKYLLENEGTCNDYPNPTGE